MDLKQLSYFIAVAEWLNFSRAAESLYISQPALSQRIADLERELNAQLLIRTRRSVQLTDAGKVFLQAALDIVNRVDELPRVIEQTARHGLQTRSLRLGLIEDAAKVDWFQQSVASTLGEVRNLFPNLFLSISEIDVREVPSAIQSGSIDLCLLFGHAPPSPIPGIETKRIYTDRICLLISRHHPLNHPGVTARDLLSAKDVDFLMLDVNPGMQQQMALIFDELQVTPSLKYPHSKEISILQTYSGLGMFFYPKRMLSTNPTASQFLDVYDLDSECANLYFTAQCKQTLDNYLVSFFLDTLEHICASSPVWERYPTPQKEKKDETSFSNQNPAR